MGPVGSPWAGSVLKAGDLRNYADDENATLQNRWITVNFSHGVLSPARFSRPCRCALTDQRVIVITGQRRVGKTTAARWLLDQAPTDNKLYLDLERLDQRAVFGESNYDLVLNFLRTPRARPVPGRPTWPWMRSIRAERAQHREVPLRCQPTAGQPGIKFILTGSSSFYLKHFFTESLSGRKVVFEIVPAVVREVPGVSRGAYRPSNRLCGHAFDPYEYERLKGHYEEYLAYGGLPESRWPRPLSKTEILLTYAVIVHQSGRATFRRASMQRSAPKSTLQRAPRRT